MRWVAMAGPRGGRTPRRRRGLCASRAVRLPRQIHSAPMARLVGDEGEAAAAKQLRAREDQIAQLDKDNYYYRQSNKCGPRDARPARASSAAWTMHAAADTQRAKLCVRHATDSGTASYSQSAEQSKGTVRRRREPARKPTNRRADEQTNKRTTCRAQCRREKRPRWWAQASEPASLSRFCCAGS